MKERKLFSQILTKYFPTSSPPPPLQPPNYLSVANYFDRKGISSQSLEEYIDSISGQI